MAFMDIDLSNSFYFSIHWELKASNLITIYQKHLHKQFYFDISYRDWRSKESDFSFFLSFTVIFELIPLRLQMHFL